MDLQAPETQMRICSRDSCRTLLPPPEIHPQRLCEQCRINQRARNVQYRERKRLREGLGSSPTVGAEPPAKTIRKRGNAQPSRSGPDFKMALRVAPTSAAQEFPTMQALCDALRTTQISQGHSGGILSFVGAFRTSLATSEQTLEEFTRKCVDDVSLATGYSYVRSGVRTESWLGATGLKTYFRCTRERSDQQKAWRKKEKAQSGHICATSLIVLCAVQQNAQEYLVTIRLSSKHGSSELSVAPNIKDSEPIEVEGVQGMLVVGERPEEEDAGADFGHGKSEISATPDLKGTELVEGVQGMIMDGGYPEGEDDGADFGDPELYSSDAEDDELVEDMLVDPEDLGSVISSFFESQVAEV